MTEKDPLVRIAEALERIAEMLEATVMGNEQLNVSISELRECLEEGGGKHGDEGALRVYDVRKHE